MKAIYADKLKNWIQSHCNPYGAPDLDFETSCKIMDMIDKMHPVEPVSSHFARWKFDSFYFHCSNCGQEALNYKAGCIGHTYLTEYCPNCGAKMKRSNDD